MTYLLDMVNNLNKLIIQVMNLAELKISLSLNI